MRVEYYLTPRPSNHPPNVSQPPGYHSFIIIMRSNVIIIIFVAPDTLVLLLQQLSWCFEFSLEIAQFLLKIAEFCFARHQIIVNMFEHPVSFVTNVIIVKKTERLVFLLRVAKTLQVLIFLVFLLQSSNFLLPNKHFTNRMEMFVLDTCTLV